MNFLRSTNRSGPYFEGWYFKHQSQQGQTLALIPAFHINGKGWHTASLQVISSNKSWWLEYPETRLQFSRQPFQVQIGQSSFGSQGIDLHIEQSGLSLHGKTEGKKNCGICWTSMSVLSASTPFRTATAEWAG